MDIIQLEKTLRKWEDEYKKMRVSALEQGLFTEAVRVQAKIDVLQDIIILLSK